MNLEHLRTLVSIAEQGSLSATAREKRISQPAVTKQVQRIEAELGLALLVRGQYRDRPEMIAAHSSPVMVEVDGSPFYAAADALTILEQIEGAMAYLDTVGTRAETQAYRKMRLILESAYRRVHNQMHAMGNFHKHSPMSDHPAHHT